MCGIARGFQHVRGEAASYMSECVLSDIDIDGDEAAWVYIGGRRDAGIGTGPDDGGAGAT